MKEVWKKIRYRIRNRVGAESGFSFVELLAATIIMMLATSLLVQTLTLAYDQFQRQTQVSEAQMLCASLSTYLESELSYATVTVGETEEGSSEPGTLKSVSSDAHNMGANIQFVYLRDQRSQSVSDGSQSRVDGSQSVGDGSQSGVDGSQSGDNGNGSVSSGSTEGSSLWSGAGSGSMSLPGFMIGETSPRYRTQVKADAYNIAGKGAYISKNDRYGLNAALECDENMGWNGKTFTITVVVYGNQPDRSEPLAKNQFTVTPQAVVTE